MKKIEIVVVILLAIICNACGDQKGRTVETVIIESPSQSFFSKFNDQEKRRALVNKVFATGDTLAYHELWDIYTYSGHSNEFLKISLIMATNFDYPQAYFDTYDILKTDLINDSNIHTNKLANYYLLKAYELKALNLETTVKERFGKDNNIPNSEKYWISISK